MKSETDLLRKLGSFEGVFCSGLFIPDKAMVTALALLFEKVHFLNQLEYVIEFSKHYSLKISTNVKVEDLKLIPQKSDLGISDPLSSLTEQQRKTALNYLLLSDSFFVNNALLFPKVFYCSLLPNSEIISVKQVKKGGAGKLNTYSGKKNDLVVSTGRGGELNKLISRGAIPIVGGIVPAKKTGENNQFSAIQLATNLAIKTIAMVLPATKGSNEEEILEARERLKDQLSPFWSAMLKLSTELSARLKPGSGEIELQKEVENAVSTIVRPALIDLVHKMEKERRQWFYRILSPVANGLKVLAGKPPTDLAGVVASSLTTGAEVSLGIAEQLRKIEALKQQSGLTYVIELHTILNA